MIADTFIKRPVTAIVISIVIVLVGLLALLNLPVSQYPDITPPTVNVSGNFTGADAQTVEQTTTTAIETQINGSPGMSYISSNSTSDGRSNISVTFNVGTNIDIATLDVQNRVSVATPTLPEAVRRLGLLIRKRNPSILMVISLYSPNGTHDATFLGNYANIFLKDALLRVDGVGDIASFGDDFSMRIWLQPDKLASLGITTNEALNALQEQNLQVAAGSVGGLPQKANQPFEYTVYSNSRLASEEEFRNIIIRTQPQNGSIVYLKDVARIELGKFFYGNRAFVNGKSAAFLLVYQTPGSNALNTAEGVITALEQIKKTFPKDVEYLIPFETVSVVKVSISEVVHTLVIALILVILVVFLFLQNWRATLIPILAIPVSIIGTFAFFIPLGFTVNTLTLFAFVLAIGIVVDDAIVVVEAVQHNMDKEKMSARNATIKAMKDISGPVVAIALILAAVFVPVGFIPGIVGKLYQQFAITIAVSVLISAFVALSLTPALCLLLLKPTDPKKHSGIRFMDSFFNAFNRFFNRTALKYTIGVRKWIKGAPYVIILLACICIALFFLFKTKPTGFIPTEDEGRLYLTYELPEATSTSQNLKVLHTIMNTVANIKAVKGFGAVAGLNVVSFSTKSNSGTLFISLKHWDERKDKSEQIYGVITEIQQKLSSLLSANIIAIPPPAIPGLGATAGFTLELQQKESTDDIQTFERIARNFLEEANKRPEIGRAFSFFTSHTPGYEINIDREKAKKLGIALTDVYGTLSTFLGSSYVNDFNIYGRNFRVMAQADSNYRGDIKNLANYYVRNSAGEMLPLSTVISTKVVENPVLISHFNLFRTIEINGEPKQGFSSGQALQALQEVADKTLPAGYGYEFSGLSRQELAAGSTTIYIFALSIVFVFLFLAALYESWSVPFSVLFAVPVGAFGAILMLSFFPGITNNIYAQIGLITLIGLAAKNAILIVEFAKVRVDSGTELIPATLDAVRIRLRPIIMTSLAFIFGVLPLAVASGAGAVARQTIGRTVIGGMLTATSLAIFIVPVLFVIITRFAYGKKQLEELKHKGGNDKSHS
ncbi:efflux RND transporter permease subunit [Solitalea koreensis]|uniref:Hydrophobic/amphiphilic exporter-1, HAE1 family n=1 Tax=Solitalea koreensis TaxID=543615 RepID=A0A521CZF9_9SPHI|nr:multidrug efflux RND transporter permease subunit [Solitalea koreensis]SMO64847.1 hydrophobic/amphiphilic exporter-1, HAE1 family [Solitalea koreensis]